MTSPQEDWKPDELDLRKREVRAAEVAARSQGWIQLAQVLAVVVALVSTVIALYTARQSENAATAATEIGTEQSDEGQLSSAISAMDAGNVSTRATNMLLINRDIEAILSLTLPTPAARLNAQNDYNTVLSAFSLYVHINAHAASKDFGPGYGVPATTAIPLDVLYAADTLRQILRIEPQSETQGPSLRAVDLSGAELYGIAWEGINFNQVVIYMAAADLRGADLTESEWGAHVDLSRAYLQCANLADADFRGTDLYGADLRGAYVQGADFSGAYIGPVGGETQVYGNARWSHLPRGIIVLPASRWNQATCLQESHYWDEPAPGSAP